MTDEELIATVTKYASERGILPRGIEELVAVFRVKLTNEQAIARAMEYALQSVNRERLINPTVSEAFLVRFGGEERNKHVTVFMDREARNFMMSHAVIPPPTNPHVA